MFVHKKMDIILSRGKAAWLAEIIHSRQALQVLCGALKLDSKQAFNLGMVKEVFQSSDETEKGHKWLKQFMKGPPEVI